MSLNYISTDFLLPEIRLDLGHFPHSLLTTFCKAINDERKKWIIWELKHGLNGVACF